MTPYYGSLYTYKTRRKAKQSQHNTTQHNTKTQKMTKEESLQLKGIAIMMMLWLHLFGTDKAILAETTKILYINDSEPFIYAMRKFGRMCVVFYTFLGGYGLAKVYQSNAAVKGLGIVTGMKNGKRVWNLFKSYWLVMTIFILIATLLQPGKYPGNIMEVALNITALDITYNDTLWFLFPYALLTLFAQPINSGLGYIGSHSTNIWFTHRYLLVLSGAAIAFFHHPIVIFAALIIICLTISHIINVIKKAIHI